MVHQSHRNVPNYSEQHCFLMTLTTQPKSCLANLVKHCATWLLRVRNNIILSSFSPQSVLYIDFGASLSEHLHQSEASSLSAVNTKHKRTNLYSLYNDVDLQLRGQIKAFGSKRPEWLVIKKNQKIMIQFSMFVFIFNPFFLLFNWWWMLCVEINFMLD